MTQANPRNATLSELVAEEVRALMGRRQMSGRTLALMLNVSPSWISYRLSGKQPIDLNDLALIAGALGVSPLDLLPSREVAATVGTPIRDFTQVSRLAAPDTPIRSKSRTSRQSPGHRRPVTVRSPGRTIPSVAAA